MCLAGDQGRHRRLWQQWRDGPKGKIGLNMLLSGLILEFGVFSNFINETLQTYPQGEQGIKGEKGSRGLWGQGVIYHTQIYHLHHDMLQMCFNAMLC